MDRTIARIKESPKAKRLSVVALTAAILAVVWSIGDTYANPPSVIVSSVTSLAMLIAGFYDHKTPPTYTGEGDG